MILTFRIGGNNKDMLGVIEATFDNEECKDPEKVEKTIEQIKGLYFKQRILSINDPAKIRKELNKRP